MDHTGGVWICTMIAPFDTSELAKKFERGEDISIDFQYVDKDIENDINSLLSKILSRFDKAYLYHTYEPVLRELMQNAVKANMKRVCFQGMKLDIRNDTDYNAGMREFKKIAYHPELLKNKLFESRYKVIINFRKRAEGIAIEVINNARIVPVELDRLRFRLVKAGECKNFTEAYLNMHDASEGAGLGIIMSAMLLKNAGLDDQSILINPDENEVKVTLRIPYQLKSYEIVSSIKDRILRDVKSLPTFPKNIIELQALCNDLNTKIEILRLPPTY
jgi:hypothetical protein